MLPGIILNGPPGLLFRYLSEIERKKVTKIVFHIVLTKINYNLKKIKKLIH